MKVARKVLAFSTSNSSVSINRALVEYAATLLDERDEVSFIDIHEYEMPIYRHDREQADGVPQQAHDFRAKVGEADALLVSICEHNGLYSAAFKNLFDWCSRIDRSVWQEKPMVLLATSPGAGGASRALALAEAAFPRFGGEVRATFSLPRFADNFDRDAGRVTDPAKRDELVLALSRL